MYLVSDVTEYAMRCDDDVTVAFTFEVCVQFTIITHV